MKSNRLRSHRATLSVSPSSRRFQIEQLEGRLLLAHDVLGDANHAPVLTPFAQFDELQLSRGSSRFDRYGRVTDGLGDINGDRVHDVVVGISRADTTPSLAGNVQVISGADGSLIHEFLGSPNERLGNSVSAAGDVNADGVMDIVASGEWGRRAHIYSGHDGSTLHMLDMPIEGFINFVSNAGDVNNDGFDDILASVETTTTVFSGSDGGVLHTLPGTNSSGETSAAAIGDWNNDGFDDVAVGNTAARVNGADSGSVTVYSGMDGTVLRQWHGATVSDRLGARVINAGDVNADGVPDVAATAIGVTGTSGSTSVFSGADGSRLLHFPFKGNIAAAGDVDGDGADDIAITSVVRSSGIYSGASGMLIRPWHDSIFWSATVTRAGDVNGDGRADLFAALPDYYSPEEDSSLGTLWVLTSTTPGIRLGSTTEDSSESVFVDVFKDLISDPDGDAKGIAVRAVTGRGTWKYQLAFSGSTTLIPVGEVNPSQALLLRDIDRLVYEPDMQQGETATLEFIAWDQTSGEFGTKIDTTLSGGSTPFSETIVVGSLDVSPINDPPMATGLFQDVEFVEGTPSVPLEDIVVSDVDSSGEFTASLIINRVTGVLTADSGNGESFSGGVWTVTGSLDTVNAALADVRLLPEPDFDGNGRIEVRLADENGANRFAVIDVDAEGVNDAPVMIASEGLALPAVDHSGLHGFKIAEHFSDLISDVDSRTRFGLAVRSTTGTGTWQFQPQGETFRDIGPIDDQSALLLSDQARVRYLAASDEPDVATLTFVVWDQSQFAEGTNIDTSARGGDTPFSIVENTVSLEVLPLNHEPTATHLDQTHGYVEDSGPVALDTIVVSDVDSDETIHVRLAPDQLASGWIRRGTEGLEPRALSRRAWTFEGTVTEVNEALADLEFVPEPNNERNSTIHVSINDGHEDSAQSVTGTIELTVTSVNDSPVIEKLVRELTLVGQEQTGFGRNVSGAGDVNQDGFDDIIVSAPQSAHIYSGLDGTLLHVLAGVEGEIFGTFVEGLGDVNGDGHDDIGVGTSSEDVGGALMVKVFSGLDGALLHELLAGPRIDRDYTRGVRIHHVGDVNRDAHNDILIQLVDILQSTVRVYSGLDAVLLHESTNFIVSASGLGDVNGDGADDFAVAELIQQDEGEDQGFARVYSGLDLTVLHSLPLETFETAFVAGVGDMDADGLADFIVSDEAGAGGSYGDWKPLNTRVYSGADGSLIRRFPFAGSVVGPGDVNGDQIPDVVIIDRGNDATVYSGLTGQEIKTLSEDLRQIDGAGDVDGDGLVDLVGSNKNLGRPAGDVFVYATRRTLALPDVFHPTLDREWTVDSQFAGSFTDTDTDPKSGIAVQATRGAGTWQYSLDSGQTFVDMGGISVGSSLLLGPNDQIRYDTDRDADEVATLTVVGWDQTVGASGARVDTSQGGGTTAFSASSIEARMQVVERNRAPTATNLQQSLSYIEGDATVSLLPVVVTDVNAGDIVHVTLTLSEPLRGTLTAGSGNGEIYDAQTGIWSVSGVVDGVNAALAAVSFLPEADNDVDVIVAIDVADGGEEVTLPTTGTILLEVTPVNDAPILRPPRGDLLLEHFLSIEDLDPPATDAEKFAFGSFVRGAGDVNADGFDDIIVGGPRDAPPGGGRVWVFSGKDASILYSPAADRTAANFGAPVSGAGDVNGDGYADFIVGAPNYYTNNAGAVFVYSGVSGALRFMLGGEGGGDMLGTSVSGAGDVNGDGFDDFIVGAPLSDANGVDAGLARVHSGRDKSVLYTFHGDEPNDRLGLVVSDLGDVNRDGFADVAVGALFQTQVFSGADGAVIATFDHKQLGLAPYVSKAGDINLDGHGDLLVYSSDAQGTVRVYSGADGSTIHAFQGESYDDTFPLGNYSASAVVTGDVNGDGYPDILIQGAVAFANENFIFGERVQHNYIFSGQHGTLLTLFETDQPSFSLFSRRPVTDLGDVNGDGIDDVGLGRMIFASAFGATFELPPIEHTVPVGVALVDIIGDTLSDVDTNDSLGIAIRSTSGRGSWQYSLDGGETYLFMSHPSETESLRLPLEALVRYVSNTSDPETVEFEFVGWDGSDGMPGARVDTSVRGGMSAFSTSIHRVTGQVVPINHAPTATNLDQTHQFDEGDRVLALEPMIAADSDANDVITASLQLSPAASGVLVSRSGTTPITSSNTGLFIVTGGIEEVNQTLASVQFYPDVNANNARITVTISDGGEDLAAPATGVIELMANGTNDAPVLQRPGTMHLSPIIHRSRWSNHNRKSVGLVADYNGDGIRDLISGDELAGGQGVARVVSAADGQLLFSVAGHTVDGRIGHAVGDAGDIDGDGISDFLVSAPLDRNRDGGTVFVHSGADQSVLYQDTGLQSDDLFGWSVAGVGDTMGDGRADFLVGAPDDDSAGKNSGAFTMVSVFTNPEGSLSSFSVHISGEGAGDRTGWSVSGVGDVNGDGLTDFVVGSPGSDQNGEDAGMARLYSGVNAWREDRVPLFEFFGESAGDQFGTSVNGIGDVSGDGVPDVAIGAPGGDGFLDDVGVVKVFSGSDGRELFRFEGAMAGEAFGTSVTDAGDVNGDGRTDILVGAPGSTINGIDSGSATVFSGADGSVLYLFDITGPGNRYGAQVSSAGDVNGDGLGDIFIGTNGNKYSSVLVSDFASSEFEVKHIDEDESTADYDVRRLVPNWFSDADPDALFGIALRGAGGNGMWQYSVDGGESFADVDNASVENAILLRATDLIRYVPDGQNAERATLTFVAWDQTEGQAGERFDTSRTGGSTAFSVGEATAVQTVRAINDAPVLTFPDEVSATDNSAVRPFAAATVSDVDEPTETLTLEMSLILPNNPGRFTPESLAAAGFEFSPDQTLISASGTAAELTSALRMLKYLPVPDINPTGQTIHIEFHVRVEDSHGAEARTVTSLDILAANDPPELTLGPTAAIRSNADFRFEDFPIGFKDQDPDALLTVEITVDRGALLFDEPQFIATVQGGGTRTLTITGAIDELNAVRKSIRYRPDQDFTGVVGVGVTLTDGELIDARQTALVITGEGSGLLLDDQRNLVVFGTSAADTFRFETVDVGYRITLNGETQVFDRNAVGSVFLAGYGGEDDANVIASNGRVEIQLWPRRGNVSGFGYELELIDTRSISVTGADIDRDQAELHDSPGDDRWEAFPDYSQLIGDGFANVVRNIERVTAVATTGDDRARLHDTPGDDAFDGGPEVSELSAVDNDVTDYRVVAQGFDRVTALGTEGRDIAFLRDSAGDDSFKATPEFARLGGGGFYNLVQNFDSVYATSHAGGKDTAFLEDGSGDDFFTGSPHGARLSGNGFYNVATAFERVYALANGGGSDRAALMGSEGDDQYTANTTLGRLVGDRYLLQAEQFEGISAFGEGGQDRAVLTGSTPALETFTAQYDVSSIWGPEHRRTARGFEFVRGRARVATVTMTFGNEQIFTPDSSIITVWNDDYEVTIQEFQRGIVLDSAGQVTLSLEGLEVDALDTVLAEGLDV